MLGTTDNDDETEAEDVIGRTKDTVFRIGVELEVVGLATEVWSKAGVANACLLGVTADECAASGVELTEK